MQSIKNTTVTIILLVLSYGVYQVITKPLPSELENDLLGSLDILDAPIINDESMITNLEIPPSAASVDETNDSIPPQLLDLELPVSDSFRGPATNQTHDSPAVGSDRQFFTSNERNETELGKIPNLSEQPEFPIAQVSSQQDFRSPAASNNGSAHSLDDRSHASQGNRHSDGHFDADSQIIPSTVMGAVAKKPGAIDSGSETSNQPRTLAETWPLIDDMVAQARFQEALVELSRFYRGGTVATTEMELLLDWLDALAAKVIYSSEHHLRSMPYIIQPGDTIGSLARQWQIPAQLIYNVNAQKMPNPNELSAGVEIKLIQGPFDAEIDSQASQLTLYLDDMYAGRFTIQPGQSIAPGEFRIVDKSAQDHLDRPFWIALNNGASIYATDVAPGQQNEIGMNLREAEEIFAILSASSKVRVLR